ncbi:MAG: hypothetical protein WCO30_02815 [bacterium]
MNNIFKNKILWSVVVVVLVIVLIWIRVGSQLEKNKSLVATSTVSELVLDNSIGTSTVQSVKNVVNPLVTFLKNSEIIAGINYPVTAQTVYYNVGGKTQTLGGYGYSFTEHSSSTQSVVLAKIKGYFSNMTIDIMNTGSAASGITAYAGDKYVCVLFEKAMSPDLRGDKQVSVKCANRPIIKK